MIAVAEMIDAEIETAPAEIAAEIEIEAEAHAEILAEAANENVEADAPSVPLPHPAMNGDELFRLGMMYSTGQGGAPLDLVSAHMLFNLAALKGSVEATVYRRELSLEMEREDVAEAQRAARRWLDQGVSTLRA
jgi:TPR repeat protein